MAIWNPFGKKNKKTDVSPESEQPESQASSSDSASPSTPPRNPDDQSGDSPETKKRGFFGGIKAALSKTYTVLNTDIRDLVGKEGRLVDEAFLSELYADLIKTDMGAGPAGKIRDGIGSKFRARKLFMKDLVNSAKETITEIMAQEDDDINFTESGTTVIMVVGVNGSGKTTSIAKLTNMLISQGKSVVLGAGDTFRAAAVEQLTIWAERLGAEIVKGNPGAKPATVTYKAVEAARDSNADVCIVDTAGRLQTQTSLMDELGKIREVIQKVIPGAPHEVLLVLDATAGQNAISQARGFSDAAGCTGIVLAKLDGSAKGGVVIPIRQEFGLPVKYIGLGEKPEDIAKFDVDSYVNALLDFDVEN